jgi:hypothetical protein
MSVWHVVFVAIAVAFLGCQKTETVSSSAIAASSIASSSATSDGACTMDGPVCPDSLPKSDSSLKDH